MLRANKENKGKKRGNVRVETKSVIRKSLDKDVKQKRSKSTENTGGRAPGRETASIKALREASPGLFNIWWAGQCDQRGAIKKMSSERWWLVSKRCCRLYRTLWVTRSIRP